MVILTKFGQNRPKDVGAVGFWKMSKEEERKKKERRKKERKKEERKKSRNDSKLGLKA